MLHGSIVRKLAHECLMLCEKSHSESQEEPGHAWHFPRLGGRKRVRQTHPPKKESGTHVGLAGIGRSDTAHPD